MDSKSILDNSRKLIKDLGKPSLKKGADCARDLFILEVSIYMKMGLGNEKHRMHIKMFFQGAFHSLLGESGARVLEFHMTRILGSDPYYVLYDNPKAFCDGLRGFLGSGANALLKILSKKIINEYHLENISPDEIVELMESGSRESRERFINLIISVISGGE